MFFLLAGAAVVVAAVVEFDVLFGVADVPAVAFAVAVAGVVVVVAAVAVVADASALAVSTDPKAYALVQSMNHSQLHQ